MNMDKPGQIWVVLGAISGFIAVACGAFGAHALQAKLDARLFQIWQTAAHYQMVHALALVAFGVWFAANSSQASQVPGIGFAIGSLIFSGTLYTLALTDIRWLGAITPIGGMFFLIAWASWAWIAARG